MTALYIFAGLWTIGITGFFVWVIFSDEFFDGWISRFFAFSIAAPFWAFLTFFPFALVHHETGPELATLLKSDWHCTQSRQEQFITYIKVGSVLVPIASISEVCEKYERKS